LRRFWAGAATVALFLVACGGDGSSEGAERTLSAALEQLRRSDGATLEFTLQSTPESLQSLARDGGDDLTHSDAQKILSSSLVVSSALDGNGSGAARVALNVAGNEDLELRTTKDTIYVRADVRSLLETFGQDPAAADQFVAQARAAGWDFAESLVAGRWLAITGFEQLAGQTRSTPFPEQQRVLAELTAALEASTTVTSAGEEGPGEHLVASFSLRDLYDRLQRIAADLGKATGPALPPAGTVPDEVVSIDLWVDGDRLTQVEFDFLQLRRLEGADVPEGVERLALRVAVSDFSGPIEVPSDAVPVDLSKVLGGMLGSAAMGAAPAQ
jgi:hypothetical protein